MADNILIVRKDYAEAGQTAGEQMNGFPPNVESGAITGTSMTGGVDYVIPADFKDHKTVFTAKGGSANAILTINEGDSYQGVNKATINVPSGAIVQFWLDSAKFVNKATGEITVNADKAITLFGYEMR